MKPEIKFHCESENNLLTEKNKIRAFIYKNYSIEIHNHDFYEMNIVFNGCGIHRIENSEIKVRTGDVFVIPPFVTHSYSETKDLDVYHILIHEKFISEKSSVSASVPGFLHLTEIEPYLRRYFHGNVFLHLSQRQLMLLREDLSIIEQGGYYDREEMIPLKEHTMWKILYQLSDLLYNQLHSENKKILNKHEQAIIKALEFIHQHYGEKITIQSLCDTAYLSRSTFIRSFSEMCGHTPIIYLNNYRCEKAKELLNGKGLSKTEIAHRCGFYDLSHMERMMKQK